MVSMLNQAAIDALCSATYLENYLDCVEDLPNDLQRIVSMLRELDCLTNETMADIKRHHEMWQSCDTASDTTGASAERKRQATAQLQRSLGRMQEIGDQKLALVAEIIEQIEGKTRQLDQSLDNLTNVGIVKEEEVTATAPPPPTIHTRQTTSAALSSLPVIEPASSNASSPAASRAIKSEEKADATSAIKSTAKRQKRQRNQDCVALEREEKKVVEEEEKATSRKKKTKKERNDNQSPTVNKITPIDPNEPTYCLCQQVSYGEMIGCDNEHCPIEWFHFDCVRLTHKPKGKWYCPRCRGTRPNLINPDLVEQQKRSDKTGSKRGAD